VARGGSASSRSAALALRVGREAARFCGFAEKVGGGKDIRLALAWLGQARRLAKDYERLPERGVAMIHWAMSRIMLRRLAGATG